MPPVLQVPRDPRLSFCPPCLVDGEARRRRQGRSHASKDKLLPEEVIHGLVPGCLSLLFCLGWLTLAGACRELTALPAAYELPSHCLGRMVACVGWVRGRLCVVLRGLPPAGLKILFTAHWKGASWGRGRYNTEYRFSQEMSQRAADRRLSCAAHREPRLSEINLQICRHRRRRCKRAL